MSFLQYVPPALFALVALFYIASLVYYYLTVDPVPSEPAASAWQRIFYRLLTAGRNSATLLWNKLCIIGGSLVGLCVTLAQTADAPEVASVINTYFSKETATVVIIACLVLSNVARRRTMP